MWARGDMKIQIPQKLGLTHCFLIRSLGVDGGVDAAVS